MRKLNNPPPPIKINRMLLEKCDALEFLGRQKDESVDMALLDPPYFIGHDTWDRKWISEKAYLDWCRQWTEEAVRCLRPGRAICVWGTLKTDTFLRYKLDILNSIPGLYPQNEIVWSYNWGGRSKKNFARKHEYVWVYSKGDLYFDPDGVRVERKQKINIRTGKAFEKGTIPTCVWEKNNHTMSKEYCKWHSAQKPIALLERLIRAYTRPGETVMDFFSGTGATAIACHNAGRDFIGAELSPDYHHRSLRRFRDLTGQTLPSKP